MMLAGAFFSIYGANVTGSIVLGLVFGMVAGLVVAAIHANFSHRLSANTFVVGIALNVFVLGITSFLTETEKNHLDPRQAKTLKIPFFHDLDIVGKSIFTNRWPIYLLVIVIPLSWWIVQRTRWGLEVRASGEDPIAADVTGIDVNKRRRQTMYYCGLMSGLGGAYYALGEVGQFNTNMTAGRGFIVNAAVIFGGWTLFGTIGGCFLFGAADALRLALPALGYTITPQVLIAAPYVLALLAMLLFAKRARKPAALAQPFERSST